VFAKVCRDADSGRWVTQAGQLNLGKRPSDATNEDKTNGKFVSWQPWLRFSGGNEDRKGLKSG
jgi:hypothetical protein